MTHTTTLLTLAIGLATTTTLASAKPPTREFNNNRQALTQLETNPLDPASIASLTDWSHPGTLDAEKIKGKVVLLAVVKANDPQSIMTLSTLTRMERNFADNGLIVAAIHTDEGFDQINQRVLDGKITIPVARDKDAVFANAMHTDDYPDLYLIDRAGNLRYADLDKRALKDTIKALTSETPQTAASNAALQAQGLEPENTKTETATKTIDPALYESAKWPPHNTGKLYATLNAQGKPLPVPMGKEKWVYNKRSLENKVLVLDFWATWCGPCKQAMPMFEEMQDHFDGKIEIVGIGGSEEFATFKAFVLKKKGNYAQMFDSRKTINNALGIQGIPHVVILSTDGIVRWQGNPLSSSFVEAVNMTIEADPMFATN